MFDTVAGDGVYAKARPVPRRAFCISAGTIADASVDTASEPAPMQILLPYALTTLIFVVLDMAWFALFGGQFYKAQLGPMMRDKIAWPAAFIFYAIYVVVLTVLVVNPAHAQSDPSLGALEAGLIGLAAYAAYNLTNISTLKGWPLTLSYVDMVWGTFASAATGYLAVLALGAIGSA